MNERNASKERLERLLKSVQEILMENSFPFFSNMLNQVKDLFMKFKEGEIIIPLVGEFSCGKSSLINALLGKPILPTDILPTTFTINEVRFSCEKDRIEINYNDGQKKEIEELVDLREIDYSNASLIRIYSSNKVIPHGIVIVDAPGLSSDIEKHEKILRDYVPHSDVIFLVIDVNQGSLTKSTEKFLNIVNSMNKKIYLILTKCDLKSPKELEEIINYAQTKYPFVVERIAITSAKDKRIEDLINLINDIYAHKSDILVQNIATALKTICEEALRLITIQLSSSKLDINEIELEIARIKKQIEQIEFELDREIEKIKNRIKEAEENAIKIFKKRMMSNVNMLVNVVFSDGKEKLEIEFDRVLREAGEEAMKYYQGLLEDALKEFSVNLESIAERVNVGTPTALVITKGATEAFLFGIFLALPGSWYINIGQLILARILLKIPQLGTFRELISGIACAITGFLAKSFVKNQIEKAISVAVEAFSSELEDASFLVFKKLESEIKKQYKEHKESYIQSLENLKIEKSKKIEEFRRYLDLLTKTGNELEKIKENLNDIIKAYS